MNHQIYHQQNKVKVVAGYALQQRLGAGSFANVYKGVKLQSAAEGPEVVAVKAISRLSEKLTKKVLQNLEIEISILRTYRHRNIVCMHQVQKTERHFYLLLEYCSGGDVQGLMRSRAAGRFSERLTRRLMRDLKAGLQFLWGQELIHRDIKPQNLLLTGPLPLDETEDPCKTPALEHERREANYPSEKFALKIADFGFARHLQSQSLAETLCGSPIYMAPEILQHQRYDAKADLWSVGTVLFEMIAGKPPFHGENHIDLLRNIKLKAVRLPPDLRVSKECVTLLRLLLNRNPLSRAGFKEFFEACDQFVALGCNGVPSHDPGTCRPAVGDLETIPENDGGTIQDPTNDMTAAVSLLTVTPPSVQSHAVQNPVQQPATPGFVTPSFGPLQVQTPRTLSRPATRYHAAQPTLTPLVPSPPPTTHCYQPNGIPDPPSLDLGRGAPVQLQMVETSHRRSENPNTPLQNSTDDNSYVMVEPATSAAALVPATDTTYRPVPPIGGSPILGGQRDFSVMKQARGMLSTSPGTGGALMGMLSGGRARLMGRGSPNNGPKVDSQVLEASKMLATAEDIGRRAITVAHLGDNRAYLAMKLIVLNDSNASLFSTTPMEGIEEDPRDHESGNVTDDSSTDVMTTSRRRRGSSISDKSMEKADEMEEMPFAIQTDPIPTIDAGLPTRRGSNSGVSGSKTTKPSPSTIRSHFSEALLCYLKALSMLKGAVSVVTKVGRESEEIRKQRISQEHGKQLHNLTKRCEVTSGWLTNQFRGVLERADATNSEMAKLQLPTNDASRTNSLSVEELIYNHAMLLGREGAVKQLLGQPEPARASYRSAGLLVETLLMDSRVEGDDRRTLESYVDGFASRINEMDQSLLQQSRLSSSRKAPGVVSLVGQNEY